MLPIIPKFGKTTNAQLSSEQRNTKATALHLKHKTHCKPKLPRVANLLKLFVMRIVRKR
ncbi:hypothetical protein FORC22_1917 [Vibrio parahaemolyticus]|nr:hypothetical protein FORC22_1917 [Vibrio parahaemolyticus]